MNHSHYRTNEPEKCTFDHNTIPTNVSPLLNINSIGKWGKKINPKTKKEEDWFI